MTVLLNGNGGIFPRVAHIAGGAADIEALLGGTATARVLSGASWQTRGQTLQTDANYNPVLTSTYNSASGTWPQINAWSVSQTGFLTQLAALAVSVFNQQVQLDASLQSPTLTNCVTELIRQMRLSSDSINASSVSVGAQTAVLATGNPVIVFGLLNKRGDTIQTPFAETFRATATLDQNSGAVARQEPLSIVGAAAAPNIWSYAWPAGSGSVTAINIADSQLNNAGNTVLFNGDMETFTANYPQDFVISTGVAGTDITAGGSGNAYTGTNCLELLGDGSTLSTLYQQFNTPHSVTSGAGGTPYKILPSTLYTVNMFLKTPSAPSAGVLRVALTDDTNTVINNDAGNPCDFSVTLSGVTTSYVAHNGTFATPTALPAIVRLQLSLTTALTSTKIIYIDDLAMRPAQPTYVGGPTVAAFAGSTNVVRNDAWTIALSNTPGLLAIWLERFFGLRLLGLQFPYSGSPTIADSLVA